MSEPPAVLHYDGNEIELPIVRGTENELGIDISKLRDETGLITLDYGFMNTGSCESAITFIDGDDGILRYRGIPIEQLVEGHSPVVPRDVVPPHLRRAAHQGRARRLPLRRSASTRCCTRT